MMNKITIILAMLLTGCASNHVQIRDEVVRLQEPYRVIQHDFTHAYDVVSAVPKKAYPKQKIWHKINRKQYPLAFVDIEFDHDKSTLQDEKAALEKIKEQLQAQYYLVVGHSHGESDVGVVPLSVHRAVALSKLLERSGVNHANIFTASSWSHDAAQTNIPRGVRVFGLPEKPNSAEDTAALFFGLAAL